MNLKLCPSSVRLLSRFSAVTSNIRMLPLVALLGDLQSVSQAKGLMRLNDLNCR